MELTKCCSYDCNSKNPGQHKPWPEVKKLTEEEISLEKCCVKDCNGPADVQNLGLQRYEESEHVWIEQYKCIPCFTKAMREVEKREIMK